MTDSSASVFLADEQATVEFGKTLAQSMKRHGLITLSGNLGTGKTTLSRGFMRALGHQGAVKSPTYTIVEPYEFNNFRVMHFDLYRLADPEELEFLGFRDYLDDSTICLIEWPEKGGAMLPPVDLALEITTEDKGRRITWEANTTYGQAIASCLQ